MPKLSQQKKVVLISFISIIFLFVVFDITNKDEEAIKQDVSPTPVLSVAIAKVIETRLPVRVTATGNIVAWQEAIISAEVDGLKLLQVLVNVGDVVKQGQVLAIFSADIVHADLAEATAAVSRAKAAAMEAELNLQRATTLQPMGAISVQQLDRQKAAAMTANAEVDAALAAEKKQRVRLAQTRVLAPSDGVLTSRTATVGAVVPTAHELFRLIEDGRLEWRAVVTTSDLDKIKPGQSAVISTRGNQLVQGAVRMVSPTIDTATHNGLVYIDLPQNEILRSGEFSRGYIEIDDELTLTLPQSAVMLKDGFHYVMQVGSNSKVSLKKISIGRLVDEQIEVTEGLSVSDEVIATGLGFLSEGDVVRIVGNFDDSSLNVTNED